jgi:hypothetical protein
VKTKGSLGDVFPGGAAAYPQTTGGNTNAGGSPGAQGTAGMTSTPGAPAGGKVVASLPGQATGVTTMPLAVPGDRAAVPAGMGVDPGAY